MAYVDNRMARIFVRLTGYTYSNLGRLFIRLFVGVMFLQFGIRHLVHYSELSTTFPTVWGVAPVVALNTMICIELVCSLMIMTGFLTRLATLPPIVSMVVAEYYILHDMLPDLPVYGLDSTDPGYLPIMFIGIYLFILIAGPGRISLDYFITNYLVTRVGAPEDEDKLEEA